MNRESTASRKADRPTVGIDIGKLKHVAAAILPDGTRHVGTVTYPATRAGVDQLERSLLVPIGGPVDTIVVMEATGHYWMTLYFELKSRGYDCYVLNPIQTRAQFKTRVRKTKTDKRDAYSIAEVFRGSEQKVSRVPPEATLSLRLLTRYRWNLTQKLTDCKIHGISLVDQIFPEFTSAFGSPWLACSRALIRLTGLLPDALIEHEHAARDVIRRTSRGRASDAKVDALFEAARNSLSVPRSRKEYQGLLQSELELIEALEAQRRTIDALITARVALLDSPLEPLGLSPVMIGTIHAESDPIENFSSASKYVAFCGLDPSTCMTGIFVASRNTISKRGSPYLRHALYLAAMAKVHTLPELTRIYKKHRKRGKHHTAALVICASKLARIIWRVLTDNRPFRQRPPKRKS